MPSQLLHILHGRAVGSALGFGELMMADNYPYFCLGCQGPDIFYHNQRTRPSALEYGSLLHRRSYGDFSAELLTRAMTTISEPSALLVGLAFASGFLLHAFLDRALHPYIISRTGGRVSGRDMTDLRPALSTARLHMFLERIIDAIMVRRLEKVSASSWSQRSLLADPAAHGAKILVPLLMESLRSVFPERALKDTLLDSRLKNAFIDAAFFYEATTAEHATTQCLVRERISRLDMAEGLAVTTYLHPVSILDEADFCNFGHDPWLDPCHAGTTRTESVEDLFFEAVNDASSALKPFWDNWDGAGKTGLAEAIGNGNLSLIGLDGKPCQARHFTVLDIERFLQVEYENLMAQAL